MNLKLKRELWGVKKLGSEIPAFAKINFEIPTFAGIKKGKLPTSHRYDHLPLLRSRPGGFSRSWLCRTCQLQRYNLLLLLQ